MPAPVDVRGESEKTIDYNASDGMRKGRAVAKASNEQAVRDLESAMAATFGGQAQFNAQRIGTNQIIEDRLAGRVSESTRAEIGRGLLASGVTGLGQGPTADAYTAYLGLTKEGLQTQGGNEYRSLYSMYSNALPLVNTVDAMRYTTLDPAAIVQGLQQESMNQFNGEMAIKSAEYQVAYNNAMGGVAAARDANAAGQARANSNAQMVQAIGSAAGSVAGAYASRNQSQQIRSTGQVGTTANGSQVNTYTQGNQTFTAARAQQV